MKTNYNKAKLVLTELFNIAYIWNAKGLDVCPHFSFWENSRMGISVFIKNPKTGDCEVVDLEDLNNTTAFFSTIEATCKALESTHE